MKTTETISVNPGKNTLRQVHEETIQKLFRGNLVTTGENDSVSKCFLSIVFPGTKSGLEQFKNYALPMRAIFASLLILTGLQAMEGSMFSILPFGIGLAIAIAGGLLAIGLLSRPVMFLSAIYFAIAGALQIRSGVNDISLFSLMFGSLLFAITGSGKYSCDFLIKGNLKRYITRKKAMKADRMMGYKAFECATKSM